jgi:transcription antitermination factor NusG
VSGQCQEQRKSPENKAFARLPLSNKAEPPLTGSSTRAEVRASCHIGPSRALFLVMTGWLPMHSAGRFETFVPKIRVKVETRRRTTPLFAGYLFVRIIDQWRALERTMGVLNVVKVGVTPSRCPDAEIAKLIDRADPDGVIRLNARPRASSPAARVFAPGAQVSIAGGPLAGFSGLYAGQTARERERILIDCSAGKRRSRSTPAWLFRPNDPRTAHGVARRDRHGADLARCCAR